MISFLLAVLLGLGEATPPASPAPQTSPALLARHLEYRFGWNTKVADAGPLTGTMSVDIQPAADGGLMVSATDSWWNSLRPSATNTCEVYANGGVTCMQRPYELTAMQEALFPLLGGSYFDGLTATTSVRKQSFELTRGINVWTCDFTLANGGPIPDSVPSLLLVVATGTMAPQGQHYREETDDVTTRIAYDPNAKLPVLIGEAITHRGGQNATHSLETVQLKLTKASP